MDGIASIWAARFGLAQAPLFGRERPVDGDHQVLLDGGRGSFSVSETQEPLWEEKVAAAWAWSSDLPHHVTVTPKVVAVTRWDSRSAEVLNRSSVESRLDEFYRYLSEDRVRSSKDVVDRMLGLFRRVRTLVAQEGHSDAESVNAFIAFLTSRMENDTDGEPVSKSPQSHRQWFTESGLANLDDYLQMSSDGDPNGLKLLPSLAIRHASSKIFQEAHFELLRVPQPDLFGHIEPAKSKSVSRGGAHFTPPPLARAITEQALRQLKGLNRKRCISILDPACGSGAFLYEAIRTLGRLEFTGKIELIGRDVSPSAVSMARFVLERASEEWSGEGGLKIDLEVENSLESKLPPADVVLMNPPFLAWSALDNDQRELMAGILQSSQKGKSDLSMAFVAKALDSIEDGSVLGTLLPASMLALRSAENWRDRIAAESEIRFLAELGDFGLFSHATVQIAALVCVKNSTSGSTNIETTTLVTDRSAGSAGDAFRFLRRNPVEEWIDARDEGWQLFTSSEGALQKRVTWRPVPPAIERSISNQIERGAFRVRDIFDVRQGVRSGDNAAFLLKSHQYQELPKKEQKYFRPAIVNESIRSGAISLQHWIFYPYQSDALKIPAESHLKKALPLYYEKYLRPRQASLSKRSSIVSAGRDDWWGLSRPRATWASKYEPRIVSKYFGTRGSFVYDADATAVVVQGFGWLPKGALIELTELETGALSVADLLAAYAGLLNSRPFNRMLAVFSPHVAGGQFDLSPRYVNDLPLPNLIAAAKDPRHGSIILELADRMRDENPMGRGNLHRIDRLAEQLFQLSEFG